MDFCWICKGYVRTMSSTPVLNDRNAVAALLVAAPGFAKLHWERDVALAYNVFGDFGIYIRELIEEGRSDEDGELAQAFKFINRAADNADISFANLVQVTVFEILSDSTNCIRAARRLLAPKPREWLEEIIQWANPPEAKR